MNDIAMKQVAQAAVKPKFRGNQKLKSKVHTYYPESIEREYQRVTDAYMKLVKDVLKEYLPMIKDALMQEKGNVRKDDIRDLGLVVKDAFDAMHKQLEQKTESFGLRRKLEALAHLTRKLTIKEWKKVVKQTLGIDIMDDYYMGEFYREALNVWIEDNVNLIKTIPKDSLGRMKEIVQEGFKTGKTATSIVKEIQRTYGIEKRHARLIARDQTAKLHGQLAKAQQTDAGVNEYIWSTSGDSRVRERHRELNGKRFRWDDPPVVDTKTGRRAHPGEDYQCRCVALPVFDIDTINVPIAKG
jgi:SPP1 gp7 family putative phage head morphogenesis protein